MASCGDALHRGMIDHMFLPRKLFEASTKMLHEVENTLLEHFITILETFHEKGDLPDTTIDFFRNLRKIHTDRASLNKQTIARQIDAVKPGQMFGMYVREQNCGILIYAPKNLAAEWIFSTFHPSLENEVISGNENDIQVRRLSKNFRSNHYS